MADRPFEDFQTVENLRKLGATLIEMKRGRILRVEFQEVVREVVKEVKVPVPAKPLETVEQRMKRDATERGALVGWSSDP